MLLVVPSFFLLAYRDYVMGFAFAFLLAGLGTGQFFAKLIALQWIFAYVIMSVVFLLSLATAMRSLVSKAPAVDVAAPAQDQERAPLLQN